jgi:hypothetical protein
MWRRILIVLAVVLVVLAVVGIWKWWHETPSPKGEAYVSMNGSTLWNGTGLVRNRIERLDWGERLTLLDTYGDLVEVRTPRGRIGWVHQSNLMEPAVWRELGILAERVRHMPTQAPAHTGVLSNLRLDPGRTSPRIGQLLPNTPVEVLARGIATWAGGPGGRPEKQNWLLVRAHLPDGSQIAGWVLGDFIQEDLPAPLTAYASSSNVAPVAWFALRKMPDPRLGPQPNYLMAGSDEPDGGACDFTMIGVYTWSVRRQHYVTAFVKRNLCGLMPIDVKFEDDPQKDVLFSFRNLVPHGIPQKITYRMRSTMVTLIPTNPSPRLPGR